MPHIVHVVNFGLALMLGKGRAASFSMLQVCRRAGALHMAANLPWPPRWIPSEKNRAGAPSRVSFGPRERASHVGPPEPSWRRRFRQVAFAATPDMAHGRPAAREVHLRPPIAHYSFAFRPL